MDTYERFDEAFKSVYDTSQKKIQVFCCCLFKALLRIFIPHLTKKIGHLDP